MRSVRAGNRRARRIVIGVARFLVVLVTTFLGLLAVTFFIGRVVPIDPVLAIVGIARQRAWWSASVKRWASTCRSGSSS